MEGTNVTSTSNVTELSHDILARFPKIELHRHLEGTFELNTLFEMSKRNKIDLPTDFEAFKREVQFPKDSEPDFLTFLSKFRNNWYRSLDDVYRIAYESVKSFSADGLHYIEVRFSPEHFALHNNFDRREITRLVVDAGNAGASEAGLTVRYLITFNRSKQTEDEMLALYRELCELDIPEIVGMDLAGDELNYPPQLFQNFFRIVKQEGRFGTTIHAGEVSPADQVRDSLSLLGADRIGHGTSAIHDEELQKQLADSGVALEQCITSNRQTGSWVDEEHHPFGRLYRNGVNVTLNSDDPTIQDSDLTDDYVKAVKYFNLGLNDLIAVNERAIESSFLSKDDRAALMKSYKQAVAHFFSSLA
ncbi:MAG: adenosine deaminase [Spirochaetia bacterium]